MANVRTLTKQIDRYSNNDKPPRSISVIGKEFAGLKTDAWSKANSVPGVSMIRPLISSDGHAGRAVETEKGGM